MSHELRTPLHSILSYAQLGLKRLNTAKPERMSEYFSKIEGSGDVLLALLNDLLDLAKLEAGKMVFDFQLGDLCSALTTAADEFHSLLSERALNLSYEAPSVPIFVLVDTQRFLQVLRNLLSNAVKFSPPGGTITLGLTCHEESVWVTVQDEGPGIPPDELEAIFDKFIQSSVTRTGAGGTGLGLSICREIVVAHHGRIWAEAGPSGGTIVRCELPQASPDTGTPSPDKIDGDGGHVAITHSHSSDRVDTGPSSDGEHL